MKKITQDKAIHVVGIELRTSNAEAAQTIPPFWQKFYSEQIPAKIPNKISDDVYAVYTNFEHEGKDNEGIYSLIIGVAVNNDEVPAGLTAVTINPSERAVFEVEKGHPEKVFKKWLEIWQHTEINKTFLADYELYHPNGEIKIFIGIK